MRPGAPFQSYMICTAPRSGSTLLCRMLEGTGSAGRPNSHFHQPSLDGWMAAYDLNRAQFTTDQDAAAAVVQAAVRKGRGGGKIFGLRMQGGSFEFFMARLKDLYPGETTDVERIEAALGPTKFLYLHRKDKLAQAISRVKAEQTGLWHRNADGSEMERLAPPKPPEFDRSSIKAAIAAHTALDQAWEAWFTKEGLEPLRLDYDTLSADPSATLAIVLDALGLDPKSAQNVLAPTARLADVTSREWAERFKNEGR